MGLNVLLWLNQFLIIVSKTISIFMSNLFFFWLGTTTATVMTSLTAKTSPNSTYETKIRFGFPMSGFRRLLAEQKLPNAGGLFWLDRQDKLQTKLQDVPSSRAPQTLSILRLILKPVASRFRRVSLNFRPKVVALWLIWFCFSFELKAATRTHLG